MPKRRNVIGVLDRRITLASQTTTTTEDGQPVESYQTYATVWGALREPRATEQREASAEREHLEREFEVRYDARFKVSDRLTFDGQTHDVISIRELPEYGRKVRQLIRARYLEDRT